MTLPAPFNHENETIAFLSKAKKRAAKNFKFTRAQSLDNSMRLAYWLYVFEKDDEAMEVCEFLSRFEFSGNFNLWSWIELSLALEARLLRARNENAAAVKCVERILSAGFVGERLEGLLLRNTIKNIEQARKESDKVGERDWRQNLMLELCIVIEVSRVQELPVDGLELMFQDNIDRLREMLIQR